MSQPINLNKVRKARDRAARKVQADENARKFGQSKAEKAAARQRADRTEATLDGHKLDGQTRKT